MTESRFENCILTSLHMKSTSFPFPIIEDVLYERIIKKCNLLLNTIQRTQNSFKEFFHEMLGNGKVACFHVLIEEMYRLDSRLLRDYFQYLMLIIISQHIYQLSLSLSFNVTSFIILFLLLKYSINAVSHVM